MTRHYVDMRLQMARFSVEEERGGVAKTYDKRGLDEKLYINDVMGMLSLFDGMPGMLTTAPANYVSVFIAQRDDDTSN